MIKKDYYNLGLNKREGIRKSIYRTLYNEKMSNIDIDVICKNAKISRKTYDKFFDDVDDALRSVMDKFLFELKTTFQCVYKKSGFITSALRELFVYIIDKESFIWVVSNNVEAGTKDRIISVLLDKTERTDIELAKAANILDMFLTESYNIFNKYTSDKINKRECLAKIDDFLDEVKRTIISN